jgi:hypothetical protein
LFAALRPVQVSKHTESSSPTMSLRPAQYASILYHFTNSVIAWVLPSGRPPTLSRCFKCQQGRVPYTHYSRYKNKNPRVFSPGVLWSCFGYFLSVTCSFARPRLRLPTIIAIANQWPRGGHEACLFG